MAELSSYQTSTPIILNSSTTSPMQAVLTSVVHVQMFRSLIGAAHRHSPTDRADEVLHAPADGAE